MTTKEVSEQTGIALPTCRKYAIILQINYTGEGRRKTYLWTEADIERLKQSLGKRGRPPKGTATES